MTVEIPDILADKLAAFTPTEIGQLRKTLESPLYLRLLSIAETVRPSANCARAGSGERDQWSGERATARLGEMRGWELHKAAIFAVLYPEPKREATEESYQPAEVSVQPETKK